jgi:hypothetical protein
VKNSPQISTTKLLVSTILAASLILLGACAQVSKQAEPAELTVDIDGLELREQFLPTLVYTRDGAPGLEQYTKFIIGPIAFNDDNPNLKEVSIEDLTEMQIYLENAMSQELSKHGYELVTDASDDAMIIDFTIIDMQIPTAATNVSLLVVPGLSTSVGEVTVEAVFTDSTSEQIIAIVLESSRGSYMFNSNPLSTTSDIRTAFDNWASGFTSALNEAHNKAQN